MSSFPPPLPPVPVQPIMYSTPVANRPGIITAIGVISIVVGSLGLMFNGMAGLQAFVMVMVSQVGKAAVTMQQAKTVAATETPAKPADPLSMPTEDRQTVVRGLAMHRAISKPRREQLDALLLKSGRQIFRLRGSDLTVEVVKQNVTESGTLPDAKGGEGSDFFIVGEGRIELADDHAKFAPGNGAEIVRVNASETTDQANWQAGLTGAQVKAVVDHVSTQANQTMNAAQKAQLAAVLGTPGQAYLAPAATIPEVTSQVQTVSVHGVGNDLQVTIHMQQGVLALDAAGNTVSSSTWSNTALAGTTAPMLNVHTTAAIAALICAVLSLALAIYLLVIGILMLRQHPRGARLHKIYAWLKIPTAIVGGIAWVMLWTSIIASTAPAGSAGAVTPTIITGSVIAIVVGCLYPVALLIALQVKSVREYFAAVQ